MKKVSLIIVLLLLIVGLSTTAETVEKDKGYISVSSSTNKELVPNQAEISIGIVTSDKTFKKASEDNKIISTKVYSSLKSIIAAGDYLKTSEFYARPEYIYTKDNKKVLDKYVVSNTITVRTKKTDLVSKFIDTAIAQGATNIDNLQFLAVDYDAACNTALSELSKKAYLQASAVAASINTQITGIKSITTTCNSDNGPRPYFAMMAPGVADKASSTPIASGKIKIYANIDASFYVK